MREEEANILANSDKKLIRKPRNLSDNLYNLNKIMIKANKKFKIKKN